MLSNRMSCYVHKLGYLFLFPPNSVSYTLFEWDLVLVNPDVKCYDKKKSECFEKWEDEGLGICFKL